MAYCTEYKGIIKRQKEVQTFHKILQQAQQQMTALRCQLHVSTQNTQGFLLTKILIEIRRLPTVHLTNSWSRITFTIPYL